MSLPILRLKKGEDRRIRAGHTWIYSNEIDIAATPLKNFSVGEEVLVQNHNKTFIGVAYINPHSLITARLFSHDITKRLDIAFFKNRFNEALQLRTRLFDQPYYRLIFSEADGLPGLVIDRFANDYVVQTNTAGMELKQTILQEALASSLSNISSIQLRNDSPIRKHEGLENYVRALYGSPPDSIQLEENGVCFLAPLSQGQKTGWFYDHRLNRARLKAYVANQKVLDVFSYLGGFGIQAASFGATSVDCIDASRTACDFITCNAKLNSVNNKVTIICDDAFDAMKRLLDTRTSYDVIILDPPAFVKKQKDRTEGLIAYQRLNELAIKLLVPGGILISCSCSMHVKLDDLMQILQRAAYRAGSEIQILERGHQGPDHPVHVAIPETDYLKAVFLRKLLKSC
ncbi:MAG: SAM-dependent methyltransferase [Gammaproteobacteria bacterium RIFCSPHIGHO2_12_FULL_37_14]|nr:MAG: SAM-dependent methyltransferase [Gammaproteobacteria bacterium RIFCSPHIGHO2_12_FULL_37_14]